MQTDQGEKEKHQAKDAAESLCFSSGLSLQGARPLTSGLCKLKGI